MKTVGLYCAIAIGLCLAGGCQPEYWYREGRTFDESKADHAECRAELLRRSDLNYVSSYERQFMEDCMRQRGYRLVPSGELPLDAKRQEPDVAMAVPWDRFYGVAGGLDE
jgi:hypothetical protein